MQNIIKEFLIFLQKIDVTDEIYLAFHLLAFFVAVPFFVIWAKKMEIKPLKAFLSLLGICIVFLALIHFIGWIEASLGLGNFGRKNAVTVYIWIPIICFGIAKLTGVECEKLCTLMAPTMPLIQAVSRPGCLVAGCCKGFPWQWGIYNINAMNFRFPMPAFEMLWMVGVVVLFAYLLKRQGYKPTNWLYPLMLVVFGGIQFVSEFFIDNAKIWNSLSLRSFHELSMVFVGVIWLWRISKENEKKNRFRKPRQKQKAV